MRTVFVANLDAELELADLGGYRRSTRMGAQIAERARVLLPGLRRHFGTDLLLLHPDRAVPHLDESWQGQCYCPTPSALDLVAATRARLPPAPPAPVLVTANHRHTAFALGPPLPGASFCSTLEALDAVLDRAPPPAGWVLKRALGFAGRWRKRVRGPLSGGDRVWAAASMTAYGGGLLVEPWVEVLLDAAQHGEVDRQGSVRLAVPTLQTVEDGRWLASRAAVGDILADSEIEALGDRARAAGSALRDLGYFGPFGIDGFRYRTSPGSTAFQPLSDLNARFTMGMFAR